MWFINYYYFYYILLPHKFHDLFTYIKATRNINVVKTSTEKWKSDTESAVLRAWLHQLVWFRLLELQENIPASQFSWGAKILSVNSGSRVDVAQPGPVRPAQNPLCWIHPSFPVLRSPRVPSPRFRSQNGRPDGGQFRPKPSSKARIRQFQLFHLDSVWSKWMGWGTRGSIRHVPMPLRTHQGEREGASETGFLIPHRRCHSFSIFYSGTNLNKDDQFSTVVKDNDLIQYIASPQKKHIISSIL